MRKLQVLAHKLGMNAVSEFQVITHDAKGGMAFGSEIKVLAHRTEGRSEFVRKSSIST